MIWNMIWFLDSQNILFAVLKFVWLRQQAFLFDLQPDRSSHVTVSHPAPPIMPKLQRSRKESQEPMITSDKSRINGRSWLNRKKAWKFTVIVNPTCR